MFHRLKKLNFITGLTLAVFLGLSYSTSHPTTGSGGYTGAPGDNSCASSSCHNGSNTNLDGEVSIEGLPASIMTGQAYTITVRITNPNGNAAKAGFQLLALNGTNGNAGSMANNSGNTSIKMGGGKNYLGHQPAINFPASNELTHTVIWTAPTAVGSNPQIKFYAVANIADGNDARTNDRIVFTSEFIPIAGSSDPLTVDIFGEVNPTCFNTNNGRATALATGGSGTYTYLWSSGQTTATATNLPGGTSNVTISDGTDQVIGTVDLTSPEEIEAVASGTPTCQGQNNGAATVLANGGTGSLTYTWSTGATSPSISNLSAGNYTVTVRDANLCSKTASTTVTTSPTMTVTGMIIPVSCNGSNDGIITSNISGGTSPFTYLWSNGQTFSSATGLAAGVYTVTVTDAAQCSKIASFTVTQPPSLIAGVNVTSQVICNGGSNGSASLSISGGSPGYSYTWSTGQTGTGNSSTINNLIAGNYSVTVVDFLDCEKIVNFTINQPPAIVITGITSNVSCQGGSDGMINTASAGGTTPYTYLWSTGQTTQNIVSLPKGTYTLITKDANQCQGTQTFTIGAPSALNVAIDTLTQISCSGANNGSLMASSIGGNGGYNYTWSNGASTSTINNLSANTYTVTVIDNKGCQDTVSAILSQPAPMIVSVVNSTPATCSGATNGSITISASNSTGPYNYQWINGQTGPVLSNVSAGNYQVTVTDGNNCTSLRIFSVQNGAPFQINAGTVTNVLCYSENTGSASIIPTANFTYLWSTGATTTSINQQPAGIYSVIGTDPQGCKSDTLKIEISQNQRLTPEGVALKNVLCAGEEFGFISIDTLTGGIGNIQFEWITADTTLTLDSLVEDTLTIGTHTLLLVDNIGCSQSHPYQVFKAPLISITKEVHQPSCFGDANGAIETVISGGYIKTTALWSNGSTNDSLYNLGMGTYILSVIDSAACQASDTTIITVPALLVADVTVTGESEAGKNDGTISVVVEGGTAPYTIIWSTGQTTFTLNGLAPDDYTFQITDARGCTSTGVATVIGGGCNLGAIVDPVNPTCFDSNDGAIGLTLPGNIEDYKIVLTRNGQASSLPLNALTAGKYVIIIEDSVGCQAIFQNINLKETSPKMSLTSLVTTKPSTGLNNGIVEATISGGTLPLKYNWSFNGIPFNQNTRKITGLDAGQYGLNVVDSLGCNLAIEPFVLERISSTDDENQISLKMYPNPVNSILNIETNIGSEIHIFNQNGKLVQAYFQPNDIHTIDVSTWPNGLYYMKVRNNGQYLNGRFTILH